ncbi:MAG: Photosynthesis system assembly factor [Solirubrobacterales bacterium]|jgi:hypothetical protein|nr:Photosynthesis system assembly factor [Solirubrobacterales bacterium]
MVALAAVARADDPVLPVDPGPDPTGQGALIDQAQSDPGEACQGQIDKNGLGSTTQGAGCDNKYTPVAKDGSTLAWSQIAGALHRDAPKPANYENTVQNQLAPIPPTVDFYTVSFANPSRGLAAGAQCRQDAPAPQPGESNKDYMDRITPFVDTCERVPVIYRYTDFTDKGPFWELAYKGDTPGYVGAITWLHNLDTREHGLRALAVGGDSTPSADCPMSETSPPYPTSDRPHCGGYPRREPTIPDDLTKETDSNCTDYGAANAKTVDVNPDGKQPNVTLIPGTQGPIPSARTDPSQSVVNLHDPPEASANCEDRWRQAHDPAGRGRAWLLSDTSWSEVDVPPEMRGMTALDASFDPGACLAASTECAFAGGLQQIWIWKDGQFGPMPWKPDGTPASPSKPVTLGGDPGRPQCSSGWDCEWNFRVRAIRFDPAEGGGATAVTAGCCSNSANPAMGEGRILSYSRTEGRWSVNRQSTLSGYCDISSPSHIVHEPCGRQHLADSIYAMTGNPGSYLVSPGGSKNSTEMPSQVVGPRGGNLNQTVTSPSITVGIEAARHWVSSARLVAGDGELQGHQVALHERAGGLETLPRSDGFMDWAVGGMKTNARAVAYTTTTQTYGVAGADGPFPLTCPAGLLDGSSPNAGRAPTDAPGCRPNDKTTDQTKAGYLFRLPSYFLNGFTLAGSTGWGVGDRGAIDRLAGSDAAAGGALRPENAPTLGAKRPGAAPPRGPYEARQSSLSSRPGGVPALSSSKLEKLPAAGLAPFGTANAHPDQFGNEQIKDIVMSRDGSQGWATGPSGTVNTTTTLYRFDGARWRRCGTDSVGAVKADPACESLWPLRHFQNGVRITALSRVPLEYGSDPTKDDDFEVIAATTPDATNRRLILRYSDGHWRVDQKATRQLNPPDVSGRCCTDPGKITDFAFSSPDDGWLVINDGVYGQLYRFDGEKWERCGFDLGRQSFATGPGHVDRTACQDRNQLIPAMEEFDAFHALHITTAGQRVYLYGNRKSSSSATYPFVLYREAGSCRQSGDTGCWTHSYDPGCVHQDGSQSANNTGCVAGTGRSTEGSLSSLSVALGSDGSYNGWGAGWFGADFPSVLGGNAVRPQRGSRETPLIQSDAEGKAWKPAAVGSAALDNLLPPKTTHGGTGGVDRLVALPGPEGKGQVFVSGAMSSVWLDPSRDAWQALPTPFAQVTGGQDLCQQASVTSMAPDNLGGIWLTARGKCGEGEEWFYKFSDQGLAALFREVPHPVREFITGAAGGGDGSFWVSTNTNVLYRYDRQTGWDRMTIPGWDPGRIVTNPSPANAIAIGADGNGVVAGKNGRIANLSPTGAVLDDAAGVLCAKQKPMTPPCGTGRDLRAAAVAPGGSAMVGGDSRAILYREGSSGPFHAITPPPTAVYATLTGISMPKPDRAWAVTDLGEIFVGQLEAGDWTWKREDTDEFGDSVGRSELRRNRGERLRAIAIDTSEQGYAVGDNGTILERTGDGSWRRLEAGYLDTLTAVTLSLDGRQALIGGDDGLILTLANGHFAPARHADRFDPANWGVYTLPSTFAGLALLPGAREGQVEAWAAQQVPARSGYNRSPEPGTILHYSSEPGEPLLDGTASRARALADAATPPPGAVSFAAFGNSNCQYGDPLASNPQCPELAGSNEAHDLTALTIRDEIIARGAKPGGPDFSLFTGDVGDAPGRRATPSRGGVILGGPHDESPVHDRWRELIADPLVRSGTPLFGTIGGRDLFGAQHCDPINGGIYCASTAQTRTGTNFQWRQSLAAVPAPWGARGASEARSRKGLSFEPVDTGGTKRELDDVPVDDPTKAAGGTQVDDPTKLVGGTKVPNPAKPTVQGENLVEIPKNGYGGDQRIPDEGVVGPQKVPTGGAHTHYALDVKRDGKAVMRLVVLDTSLKSLAAADGQQNPVEEQIGWLKDALQRPQGERAVVLTNTPTYSYGPGANTETVTEGTVLEAILIQNKVDLVVDGRLGWNALYYALAPGVHWPCPGSSYPASKPPPLGASCNGVGSSGADKAISGAQTDAQKQAAELTGNDVSAPGTLPFLVSHSAGGKFGPGGQGDGSAKDGYWRGYSVVHLDTETGQIQVEQRPVFDWIGIAPASPRDATHVLRAHQAMTLTGYGREVMGIDVGPRYDEITNPAITHCYDLVWADQEKPWLPLKAKDASKEQLAAAVGAGCGARSTGARAPASSGSNPCDPYVCLDPAIGRLTDDQQGKIEAGNGNVKRTFAIAILSVGQKVATYPISFEPRPSFTPEAPPPPPPPGNPPPPPPPPPPPNGQLPQINLPTPPVPPSVPLDAGLVPPPPPAVPPPPGASSANPLNLFLNGPGLNIAPQSTVVPPPAPPIQPAPPGGARKEARQKQAATQDSGAGTDETSADGAGDLAQGPQSPTGSEMTRRDPNAATRLDRVSPGQSFTPLAHHNQPSAWARDLQWGGGLTLMALVLAFGWITVRPTPRRRMPEVPAPVEARTRRH